MNAHPTAGSMNVWSEWVPDFAGMTGDGRERKGAPLDRAVDWPYASVHRDIRLGRVDPEWAGEGTDGEFGEREADIEG